MVRIFFLRYPQSSLTLYYMKGHIVHRFIDNRSRLLSRCPKWAHNSWLCFFQNFMGPVEASFQNKLWNFEKSEEKNFLQDQRLQTIKRFVEIEVFFVIIHTFISWIWILHVLSFFLRYITWVLVKIFKFSLFYYRISIDNQVLDLSKLK